MTYLRFFILDSVGFVDNQVAPVKLLEDRFFLDHHFIRGNANVPLTRHQHVTNQRHLQVVEIVQRNILG